MSLVRGCATDLLSADVLNMRVTLPLFAQMIVMLNQLLHVKRGALVEHVEPQDRVALHVLSSHTTYDLGHRRAA